MMLPLASVTRMDPSPVMPSRMGNAVKTGAVIGTTIGAAAGAVVGALVGGIDAAASGSGQAFGALAVLP